MTETQVEQAVGYPDSRERDSWMWLDLDQHHEEVTITWENNRVKEVTLSDATPGAEDVKKRKPPATPANANEPQTAPEPPREPAEQVSATGTPPRSLRNAAPIAQPEPLPAQLTAVLVPAVA